MVCLAWMWGMLFSGWCLTTVGLERGAGMTEQGVCVCGLAVIGWWVSSCYPQLHPSLGPFCGLKAWQSAQTKSFYFFEADLASLTQWRMEPHPPCFYYGDVWACGCHEPWNSLCWCLCVYVHTVHCMWRGGFKFSAPVASLQCRAAEWNLMGKRTKRARRHAQTP